MSDIAMLDHNTVVLNLATILALGVLYAAFMLRAPAELASILWDVDTLFRRFAPQQSRPAFRIYLAVWFALSALGVGLTPSVPFNLMAFLPIYLFLILQLVSYAKTRQGKR
jgi:hypothetical protein